jgi:hypothetical protein
MYILKGKKKLGARIPITYDHAEIPIGKEMNVHEKESIALVKM